jgi:SSS family solute:Na+ symporter
LAKLDLVIVGVYMIGIVLAGFRARQKASTHEQFLVAGRLRHASGPGTFTQSRSITLLLGFVMTALSCVLHDVVTALTVAYDLLVGGLLVSLVGAMILRRVHRSAAMVSITVGGAFVLAFLFAKGLDSDLPIYAALAASLIAFAFATLVARGARGESAAKG